MFWITSHRSVEQLRLCLVPLGLIRNNFFINNGHAARIGSPGNGNLWNVELPLLWWWGIDISTQNTFTRRKLSLRAMDVKHRVKTEQWWSSAWNLSSGIKSVWVLKAGMTLALTTYVSITHSTLIGLSVYLVPSINMVEWDILVC